MKSSINFAKHLINFIEHNVGLKKVITFAKQLNIDFSETARLVANSSADAGQRLKTQITNLSISIGTELIPIGAALQKQFSDMLLGFQDAEGAITAAATLKVAQTSDFEGAVTVNNNAAVTGILTVSQALNVRLLLIQHLVDYK